MTDFEKSLLSSSVIMSHSMNKKTQAILKILEVEDYILSYSMNKNTTEIVKGIKDLIHTNDEYYMVLKNIGDYIRSIVDKDFSVEDFINNKIFPQLATGNYANIIIEIEAVEYRYLEKKGE